MTLPEGEDLNEWLAVHGETAQPKYLVFSEDVGLFSAVDFFNHLNMLYGTVTEFCGQTEV